MAGATFEVPAMRLTARRCNLRHAAHADA